MEPMLVWNIVLTLVIAPAMWFVKTLAEEVQRIQILLNMTREEYMKRTDHASETDRIIDHLKRVEDKIDRITERRGGERL